MDPDISAIGKIDRDADNVVERGLTREPPILEDGREGWCKGIVHDDQSQDSPK